MDDKTVARIFDKLDDIGKDVTSVRNDISEVKISIAQQPCKVHEEKFKSRDNSLRRVWTVIYLILAGLISLAWKALK